jgi:integrase
MAYITKLKDKPRKHPWIARIRRKGYPPIIKMHPTREEAVAWAHEQERSIRTTGLPLPITQLKQHTVGDIVERYLDEVTPTKKSHVREASTLKRFLQRDIAKKSLAYVSRQDAKEYEKERLKESYRDKLVTPSTVRREMNFLQDIFEVAREDWGHKGLVNPFRGLKIKGAKQARDRVLNQGELEKLEQACEGCHGNNKYYVKLAIRLAIITGMRLQEIFNLSWEDISVERREIKIRKSKTDYKRNRPGRTIALPFHAEFLLLRLVTALVEQDRFELSDRIFVDMTKGAFSQAWLGVVKRANISDLHFHDLRHEAASFFHKAGLTNLETGLMLGHSNKDTTSIYTHPDLKTILEKIDRYRLGEKYDDRLEREAVIEKKGLTLEQAAKILDEVIAEKEPAKTIPPNVVPFINTRASS